MTTKIFVKNLAIHGFHGVASAERSLGQKFYLDIVCELSVPRIEVDEMASTVCYGELCDLAHEISATSEFNLIETLGHRIIDEILLKYDLVVGVKLNIRKPSAPIRHIIDHVGIEIYRKRH